MNDKKKNKFQVDDLVLHPKDLYGNTNGKITAVERVYAEVDDDGKFTRGGLHTLEITIEYISLPYEFNGETLVVKYPEDTAWNRKAKTQVSKFYGYAYTVNSGVGDSNRNTLWSEKSLRLI